MATLSWGRSPSPQRAEARGRCELAQMDRKRYRVWAEPDPPTGFPVGALAPMNMMDKCATRVEASAAAVTFAR